MIHDTDDQRSVDIRDTAEANVRRDCMAAKRILLEDLMYKTFCTDDVVEIARLIGKERRELDSLWSGSQEEES